MRWGKVINLIPAATACPPAQSKTTCFLDEIKLDGIWEWLSDLVFVLPFCLSALQWNIQKPNVGLNMKNKGETQL